MGSLVLDDQQLSGTKPKRSKTDALKGKTKSSSVEERAQELNPLKVSEIQSTKRRVKQVQVAGSNEEVKTTLPAMSHKLSIKRDEVSGKEASRMKRKAHQEIATGVGASGEFNLHRDQNEPWTVFAHKKPQERWTVYNPRTMRPPRLGGDTKSVKLMSWNVNGLGALLKLQGFSARHLAQREDFDVLCLEETRLQKELERYFMRKALKVDMSAPQNGDESVFSSKRSRTEINLVDLPVDSEDAQNELQTFLKASICAARFHLQNGLVFYDPNDYLFEVSNEGLFLGLLKFVAGYNEDITAILASYDDSDKLELAAADLRKDIITVAAFETTNEIIRDLDDAPFSLLLDETFDMEGEAQMAVAVRYVDKRGQVIERFLGIEHVTSADALSYKTAVEGLCCRLGLRTDKLLGQGYGPYGFADNLNSKLNGLKMLLLNDNPCAHYVHSFAHKLQSTLVDLARHHLDIFSFFQSFCTVGKIVGASCKHQDFLREKKAAKLVEALNIGELASGQGSNPEIRMEYSADTSCGSQYSALVNLIGMFAAVIDELELISDDGSGIEERGGAHSLLDSMLTFDFIFCLHLMKTILGTTNELSLALEMRDERIVNAMDLVQVSKGRLHLIRETGWTSLLDDVTSFCVKHEVEVPNMDDTFIGSGWTKLKSQDIKNLHYYQVEVFYAVIDLQIQELIVRFTDSSIELLLCVACLNPLNSFSMFDKKKLISLAEFYPKEFSPVELTVLGDQLDTYILDVRSSHEFSRLNTISDLGKEMVETGRDKVYPLVYLLLTLALILPVAIPAREFSGMTVVKDRLSYEIGDKWMSDRLMLRIEQDVFEGLSYDTIIQSLQKMKPRWADCKSLH